MSTVVDQRVVSMEFDNKKFEQNVQTSMSTIDKLKQKLNFKGASKGLESIKSATDEVVKSEYEAYQSGFKLRDVWLKTASIFEYQVAGKIIGAAKRMVSAFTIDPIKTGLAEYETQLNSVQTILANTESKGSTLEDVNAALDELNSYADKTIYNFTEMTRNIGTFTAAGVDLDTSVSAIKGIANLAAVSGSTSQQASTAMYQLSQALASGTVKLMDWNSVVNAGMGGQVFQDALKETARVHGIAIDEIIKNNGSFRESLQEGWLTSEILTETLSKFTGDLSEEQLKSMGYTQEQIKEIMKLGQTANDAATKVKTFSQLMDTLKEAAQSGWAQTFEIIIGDFEEAKELWTSVSDVVGGFIGDMSDARNKLLSETLDSGWDKLLGAGIMDESGYSHYIKQIAKDNGVAIDDMIKEHGSLEKALREGFKSGKISANVLSGALDKLAIDYSNCSEEQLKNLGYTKDQVDALIELNTKVKNGTISMEEFAEQMSKLSGRELLIESLKNIFKGLLSVVKPIKDAFNEMFPATTANQLYNLIQRFHDFTAKLKLNEKQAENLKRTFKGIFAVFDIVITVVKTLASAAFKVFGSLMGVGNGILGITASLGDFLVGIRDSIKGTGSFTKAVGSITNSIVNFVKTIKEKIGEIGLFNGLLKVLKTVFNVVKTIFGEIAKVIGNAFSSIKEGGINIFDILTAILTGGVLYKLIDFIKSLKESAGGIIDAIKTPFTGIAELFDKLGGVFESWQQKLKADALKSIGTSLLMMAAAILILSTIKGDKLVSALLALAASLGILVGAVALINLIDVGGGLNKSVKSIRKLATALLILSLALKILGTMSWSDIVRALVAMTVALVVLIKAIKVISKIKNPNRIEKDVKSIRSLSISLILLAAGLKILGTMSWDDIGRALVAMTGAFGVLIGSIAVISKIKKPKRIKKNVEAIRSLSISLILLAAGLKILGTMSWDDIGRALVAMTGALVVLVGVTYLLAMLTTDAAKDSKKASMAILTLSFSLLMIATSLKILASMSWENIAKSLYSMIIALTVLVAALAIMSGISSGGTMIACAAAILILAVSLAILVPVLYALGSIPIGVMVSGLLAMAGVFVVIAVAGMLLAPVTSVILSLSAALLVFGVATLLIGTGIFLLASGISVLATALVANGALIINTILSLVKGIIGLIPLLLISIAEGIVGFCKVILDAAPVIAKAITTLLLEVVNSLVETIPALADGLFKILIGVLDKLIEYIPPIVDKLMTILIKIIEAISLRIPELVVALFGVVIAIIKGVLDALGNIDPKMLLEFIAVVGLMAALMALLTSLVILAPGAMLGILAFATVIAEMAVVLVAFGALAALPGVLWLIEKGGDLLQAIGTAIGQFIGGILGGLAKGLTNSMPALAENLSQFMINLQPFLNGMSLITDDMVQSSKRLVDMILGLAGANLVNSITSFLTGGSSMVKMANELVAFGEGIRGYANAVSSIDPETIAAAVKAGESLAEMANNMPLTGGIKSWWEGETDLETFGKQLVSLGTGIKGFADATSGINPEEIKAAAYAGKNLVDMANNMPLTGGIKSWWEGETNLETFGNQAAEFGSGLKKFADNVNGIQPETIKAASDAGMMFADLAYTISETESGINNLPLFGENIKRFGSSLKTFVVDINSLGDISTTISTITQLNDSIMFLTDTMEKSITSAETTLSVSVSNMFNSMISSAKVKINEFVDLGKELIKRFIMGVLSMANNVKESFSSVISGAISAIQNQDNYLAAYGSGQYLTSGLTLGIQNGSASAISAAQTLANSVNAAFKSAFRINSPSKVTYADGMSLIEGLVKSLHDHGDDAYKAGGEVANTTTKGIRNAILKINDVIDSDMNTQPTIRPVLDLSDINAGADAIGGMFGMTPSIGVLSRVGSINSSMNKIQNRGNDDVISAIHDLSNKLENVASSNNVYNLNGITYDDGSNLQEAVKEIIRAAKIERRV